MATILRTLGLVAAIAGAAVAVNTTATCPYDGMQAVWTGHSQGAGQQRSCEYSHTFQDKDGKQVTHTFWLACGE